MCTTRGCSYPASLAASSTCRADDPTATSRVPSRATHAPAYSPRCRCSHSCSSSREPVACGGVTLERWHRSEGPRRRGDSWARLTTRLPSMTSLSRESWLLRRGCDLRAVPKRRRPSGLTEVKRQLSITFRISILSPLEPKVPKQFAKPTPGCTKCRPRIHGFGFVYQCCIDVKSTLNSG